MSGSPPSEGMVELDGFCFGTKCIRGRRSRETGGKAIVYGILKRSEKVYAEIVPDA